jgi:alanine racemase
VGYADGYPLLPMDSRTLRPAQPERRVVRVQYGSEGSTGWAEAPVIGAVSMDQIAIDLTSISAALPEAGLHTVVEVVSGDTSAPNHAARVASMTGQHAYELLCRIPARVPRRYLAGQEPVVRVAEEPVSVVRVAS